MVELLDHENYDLLMTVINFFADLIDFDENYFESEILEKICERAINNGFLNKLVACFDKFKNEDTKESKNIVFKILKIMENILNSEIKNEEEKTCFEILGCDSSMMTELASFICTKGNKSFNSNRLYCSEILSILLLDQKNQAKFGEIGLIQFILEFLRNCMTIKTFYEDEKETILNLFGTLEMSLLIIQNVKIFLESEGIEIMLKMLK